MKRKKKERCARPHQGWARDSEGLSQVEGPVSRMCWQGRRKPGEWVRVTGNTTVSLLLRCFYRSWSEEAIGCGVGVALVSQWERHRHTS
jgi:hypothetical protein